MGLQPTDIFLCQRGTTLYQIPASELGQVRGVTGSAPLQVVMANGIAHLSVLSASTSRAGAVQLADANDLNAGTPGLVPDAQVLKAALAAVTIPSATTVLEGKVRLASEAEITAGTVDAVVTASGLHAFIYGTLSGNWLPDPQLGLSDIGKSVWDGPDDRLSAVGDVEFRINGGSWGQSSQPVRSGDDVEVRYKGDVVDAAAHNTGLTGTVQNTANTVHRTWSVVVDRQPGVLTIAELNTAAPGQVVTSAYTQPLSGVNVPVRIWGVSSNQAEVQVEEGPWIPLSMGYDQGVPIVAGQRLRMRHRAAEGSAAVTSSSLSVGAPSGFVTVEFRSRNATQVAPVIGGINVSEANTTDTKRFTSSVFYADVVMSQPGVPKEEVRVAGRVEGMVGGPVVTGAITAVNVVTGVTRGGLTQQAGTLRSTVSGAGYSVATVNDLPLDLLSRLDTSSRLPVDARDLPGFLGDGSGNLEFALTGCIPGKRFAFWVVTQSSQIQWIDFDFVGGRMLSTGDEEGEIPVYPGGTPVYNQSWLVLGTALAETVSVKLQGPQLRVPAAASVYEPSESASTTRLTFTNTNGLNLLHVGDSVEQDNAAAVAASLSLVSGVLGSNTSGAASVSSTILADGTSLSPFPPHLLSNNDVLRVRLTNCKIGGLIRFQGCMTATSGSSSYSVGVTGTGFSGASSITAVRLPSNNGNVLAGHSFSVVATASVVELQFTEPSAQGRFVLYSVEAPSNGRGPAGVVETIDVIGKHVTLRDTVGTFTVGRTVHGPERALEQAVRYLLIDSQGHITGLSNAQQPPVVLPMNGARATLTFPATFPSGHPPDTDIPNGSQMVIRATASNVYGGDEKESQPFKPAGSAATITAASAAIGFDGYDAAAEALHASAVAKLTALGLSAAEIAAILQTG